MKILTHLLMPYLVTFGILAAGMLAILDMTVCSLFSCNLRAAQQAVGRLNERNYELSKRILTVYGERLVEAKAEDAARALSSILSGKEPYEYDRIRSDPQIKRLATQEVESWDGVAGYLSLTDENGISVLDPDETVQGADLVQWKREYPDFWKLVEESFTNRKVKGYYTFLDKGNRPRKGYQVRVRVPGTPFVVAAIVNIDEYFTPVHERMRQVGLSAEKQVQASIGESTGTFRHKVFLLATAGVISLLCLAGLFGIAFARAVSKPIIQLRDGVRSMGGGNLKVQVPEKGAKEVKELAQSFNELGAQLTDYIARRDFVRDTFGRYMTNEVADRLLESPGGLVLGGETREITILMSDVRGFSALAANMRPDVSYGHSELVSQSDGRHAAGIRRGRQRNYGRRNPCFLRRSWTHGRSSCASRGMRAEDAVRHRGCERPQ